MKPKAPVPYYGGKQYQSTWINSLTPQDVACYVEPFGGMASVMLTRKRPPKNGCVEVYNDIDGRLVNLFRHLQSKDDFDDFIHAAKWIMRSRAEYKRFHEIYHEGTLGLDGALACLVCHAQGFGSIPGKQWGTMKALYGPGRKKGSKGMIRNHEAFMNNLETVRRRLHYVVIECLHWKDVLRSYDGDDSMFYCDPPYMMSTRTDLKVYGNEMSENDHEDLLISLLEVDGGIALSGYDNDMYRDMLSDWDAQYKVTNARVNGGKLSRRVEMLWRSPKCMEQVGRES